MAQANTPKDYVDEECLIYLDFETKLLEEHLVTPNPIIKFLGIETENPVVQINNKIFKGSYDYAMGTNLFFAEGSEPTDPDPNFKELPKKMYRYYGKSDKVLKMKRIFVEEVDEGAQNGGTGDTENPEHCRVKKTYEEALNQFLKPGQTQPRSLADDQSSELLFRGKVETEDRVMEPEMILPDENC